jgi:isopenicillin-N N-acyltransferase-like protein
VSSRLKVLAVGGSPSEMGAAHGAAYGDEIREYAAGRADLARAGTDLTHGEVLAIAESMLDAHHSYDADLYDEMVAMADAAQITPAEAVIVGGFTDFIDAVRNLAGGTAMEDTCTAVITPNEASGGSGFLAQTWDMHASATPHVFMLDLAPSSGPRSMIFTTHGTLGQIGMNEAGIAVGINNLSMDDGRIGVTWPFVVRKALRQTSFADAMMCISEAPLAGGHSFLILDRFGEGASVEATPSAMAVERLSINPLIHTNHCLFPETAKVESVRPSSLQSSSVDRLSDARRLLAEVPEHTSESLIALLRDERSICRRPSPPFDYESSGAVVMRPATGDMWACWGNPTDNDFERFTNIEASRSQ